MVTNAENDRQAVAVLLSGGLDSAVLLAHAASQATVQPIYVRAGLAWEAEELAMVGRLLAADPNRRRYLPLVTLTVDMRDVYPPTHWAVRGDPPAFDTPDEDVYLDGRNIVLLSKTAVFMARAGIGRVLLGPLAGNPFPDATPLFFEAMAKALSEGLATGIVVETPFASMNKAGVIRIGQQLSVPLELTLSCMQPLDGMHCGRCSKCRERRDAFAEARVPDPTRYSEKPLR
jgi:7-cyano-7-deazaguanine synthase